MKNLFQIIYSNSGDVLTTENRPQYVEAGEILIHPSETMVKNALHTVCLDNNIKDFKNAKAVVMLNGVQVNEYSLKK